MAAAMSSTMPLIDSMCSMRAKAPEALSVACCSGGMCVLGAGNCGCTEVPASGSGRLEVLLPCVGIVLLVVQDSTVRCQPMPCCAQMQATRASAGAWYARCTRGDGQGARVPCGAGGPTCTQNHLPSPPHVAGTRGAVYPTVRNMQPFPCMWRTSCFHIQNIAAGACPAMVLLSINSEILM